MDTQHSGYGKVDVEVGVVVEVRHGEQLALTALLIGQTVFPVENAQTEILLQCKGYETDVSRRLHHVCSVFGDGGHLVEGGTVVVDTQIGVVLYVVIAGTKGGASPLEKELCLEVGLHLLVEVVMLPREELAVIATLDEVGVDKVIERLEAHGSRVAKQSHIEVA